MLATDGDFHWPIRPKAIFQRFDYVGPYFIDPALSEATDDYMLLSAIDEADIVFAYLTDEGQNTRFGIELGYAAGLQKPIWISTSSANDLLPSLSGCFLVNLTTKLDHEVQNPSASLWNCLQQEGAFYQSPLEQMFWQQLRRLGAGWVAQ